MRALLYLTSSLAIVGCVDDNAASVETTALHNAPVVRVSTTEPPSLIAYRLDGSSTWRTPVATSPRTFELSVSGPYRLVVVCEDPDNGTVTVREHARTPQDPRWFDVRCKTTPAPYRVTGTMVQPGRVYLGDAVSGSNQPNWQFDLFADRGRHALIASTADRIAIRRRVKVRSDVVLTPPIDVDVEGVPRVPVTFHPTNLNGDETRTSAIVFLEVGGTTALIGSSALDAAKVAPNSVLRPNDRQGVVLAIHGPSGGRTIEREFRVGDSTTFPLPTDMIGPVSFNGLAVTWSTLPAYDKLEVYFEAYSFETNLFVMQSIELTPRFVAATGITSVSLAASTVPGFDPNWELDLAQEYYRFIGTSRTRANGDVVGSDIAEVIEP